MFGIEPSEFMVLGIVALVVIGPKDLPRVMRVVGQWVGRARGVARHFRSGFDEMVRQAEMEEMEKRWAAENARIMAEHPAPVHNDAAPAEERDDAHFAATVDYGAGAPPAMTPLPPPAATLPATTPPPAADPPAADPDGRAEPARS